MVIRKSRIMKEKKPLSSFGQLILPLTLIMTVALLFFSVKLFFSELRPDVTVGTSASMLRSATLSSNGVHAAAVKEMQRRDTKVLLARPVGDAKKLGKKQKNKSGMEYLQKPASAINSSAVRWDLQIGAFSYAANANILVKKAEDDGFDAYTIETVTPQGKKVFAVRVTGAPTRGETESAAKKLKSKSYEYFLLKVGK